MNKKRKEEKVRKERLRDGPFIADPKVVDSDRFYDFKDVQTTDPYDDNDGGHTP